MNEIQRTAQVFWKSTGKAICLYNTKKRGTVGGFFNDAEKFAAAAFEQSVLADAPAVFMSLQVLAPGAKGNKLTEHAAAGFRQEHVEFYAWLLIDCDPVRDDGNRHQSTTEAEKARAFQLATKIRAWLNERRYENGLCDSGNGFHVYVPVDVARSVGAESIPDVLLALKARFETPEVEIDTSVGDPAQVIKVYGTVSRKGPDTPDRPHRLAKFVEWPAEGFSRRLGLQDWQMLLGQIKPELTPEQLEALEGRAFSDEVAEDDEVERSRRNIRRFLEVYELSYKEKVNGATHDFPYQFHITCPFCVNSKNPEKTFLFPTQGAKMAFFCGEPRVGKCRDGIRRFWKDFEAKVQGQKGVRFVEWESASIICENGYYGVPPATRNTTLGPDGNTTTNTLSSGAIKEFKYHNVKGTSFDYICEQRRQFFGDKLEPGYEGWFARGSLHLIGGNSGAGKSKFMLPLLETQARGESAFGHRTFGHPYLVLLADRDEGALERALKETDPAIRKNCVRLEDGAGIRGVLRAIEDRFEAAGVMPVVVFIEGINFVMGKVNDADSVSPLMGGLMKIARHYHLAIIGSLGSSKLKQGEEWTAKRSALIGTQAWGRRAETILVMEGQDDEPRRLTVLSRNGRSERYEFVFNDLGQLVESGRAFEEDEEPLLNRFAKKRALEAADEDGQWFTSADYQEYSGLSQQGASRQINKTHDAGTLRIKPGKRRGNATAYGWALTTLTTQKAPLLGVPFEAHNGGPNGDLASTSSKYSMRALSSSIMNCLPSFRLKLAALSQK